MLDQLRNFAVRKASLAPNSETNAGAGGPEGLGGEELAEKGKISKKGRKITSNLQRIFRI